MNSNQVCVDASVAIIWLFEETHSETAEAIRKSWYDSEVEMVVPSLFHAEVISTISKHVYFKTITRSEGQEAFSIYWSMVFTVIDGLEVYRKAWDLTIQNNLPVCYDMYYLAVAELMNCPLWTNDKKLVNSLKGKNKLVKYLGDYLIKS